MAAKPAAAPQPADDEDETEGAQPEDAGSGDDSTDDSGSDDEGSEGQPRVLLTVMCNPDGSYTVMKGDEDDQGEGGSDEGDEGDESDQSESGSDEDDGAGEEGGAAEGAESEGSQGETYHSVGQALKAILDIFREDEAEQQGGSSDDFSAGYKGEAPEGAGGESEAPATVKY